MIFQLKHELCVILFVCLFIATAVPFTSNGYLNTKRILLKREAHTRECGSS